MCQKWGEKMRKTIQKRIGYSEQLQNLAHEAGEIYSRTLVWFWRILRKKGIWLSQYGMQGLIHSFMLHSQTVQGIVDIFYANIKSWRKLREGNPKARMPKKRKWYFVIPYKEPAIRLKDKKLILSNGIGADGKRNAPLIIDWPHEKPKYVEITYDDGGYIVNAVYNVAAADPIAAGDTAGIDLGEVHIAGVSTAGGTMLVNGRELRSKRRYQHKETGKLQSKIDKCKKGSKRRKRLTKAKKRMRRKLNNQIKDILHKQTTKIVYALKAANVKTVAIGDVRDIRQDADNINSTNAGIGIMSGFNIRKFKIEVGYKHGLTNIWKEDNPIDVNDIDPVSTMKLGFVFVGVSYVF